MATCINKNLSEFKEVANVMGSPILANSLIASWQIFNNSDSIPTVVLTANCIESENIKIDATVASGVTWS